MKASPDPGDLAVERRIQKRKLFFWRLVGLALVATLLLVLFPGSSGDLVPGGDDLDPESDYIAEIRLEGFMDGGSADEFITWLERAGRDRRAKAILVRVDSPGGVGHTAEMVAAAIGRMRVRDGKPVVAQIMALGTSAAYIAAVAADHVVAARTSVVGSIGALFVSGDLRGLLDRAGARVDVIASSPIKGRPFPFEEMSPEVRGEIQGMVDTLHDWMVSQVARRRGLERQFLTERANGNVFLGEEAAGLGLIDAIGHRHEAVTWLEENGGVPRNLPVRDIRALSRSSLVRELLETADMGFRQWPGLGLLPGSGGSGRLLAVWYPWMRAMSSGEIPGGPPLPGVGEVQTYRE